MLLEEKITLAKAWTDHLFRSQLPEEVLQSLPQHPAGDLGPVESADLWSQPLIMSQSWSSEGWCCETTVDGGTTDDAGCSSAYFSGGACCYAE